MPDDTGFSVMSIVQRAYASSYVSQTERVHRLAADGIRIFCVRRIEAMRFRLAWN